MFLKTTLFPTICSNFLFTRVLLRYFVFLALWAVVLFSALGFGCLLFPRLASVVFFSLAWLWLSSFPALCYVILVFPRLAPVALFSCAWLGFLVFPRLSPNGLFFPLLAPVALFSPPRCSVRCFLHLTHTTANIFWPFIPSLVFRTGSLFSLFALVMQPMI